MKKMLEQFSEYIKVYGIDKKSESHDEYVLKFFNDMKNKEISELTDKQLNFLKSSCKEVASALIVKLKDCDEETIAIYKDSLIFYRDNLRG